MQDFYGEDPFVLNKDTGRVIKNKQKVNVGVNKRTVAIITIVSLITIFITAFCVFEKAYTVVVPAKKYYAVCFYSGQLKSEAESVSAGLMLGGGSGYIVNDGTYKVYGGIYKDNASAESVAKKQTEKADVECIGWNEIKISALSESESKRCGEALIYFSGVIDNLVLMSVNLDMFVENDASVELYVKKVSDNFKNYSDSIENDDVKNFFGKCIFSIKNNMLENSEGSFNSHLKYVVQDLIMLRINLDTVSL